jgi:hypothetical protein
MNSEKLDRWAPVERTEPTGYSHEPCYKQGLHEKTKAGRAACRRNSRRA